ncbi:hypothetical protein SDC9_124890 [bioreactor metagenome]|uniref:Uncharacterized protein n=1 Tax=bioreactor metagenome TaxID=1076179 RepID=A0A645CLR2_9ZZZZ
MKQRARICYFDAQAALCCIAGKLMMSSDHEILIFHAAEVEYYFDVLDCNVINFRCLNEYFSIQVQTYLDPDNSPIENEPYFEMNHADCGMYMRVRHLTIGVRSVRVIFEDVFAEQFKGVEIFPPEAVGEQMVDFFVNQLFMGGVVKYADDFPLGMRVVQTRSRDVL